MHLIVHDFLGNKVRKGTRLVIIRRDGAAIYHATVASVGHETVKVVDDDMDVFEIERDRFERTAWRAEG